MAGLNVNLVAVLVCSALVFILGALWYSPLLFAKKWMALLGKTPEELKQGSNPMMYVMAFITGFMSCFVIAFVVNLTKVTNPLDGALVGLMCWTGLTAAPTYNNQVNFVHQSATLWAIDSGYNLASFVIAGVVFVLWK